MKNYVNCRQVNVYIHTQFPTIKRQCVHKIATLQNYRARNTSSETGSCLYAQHFKDEIKRDVLFFDLHCIKVSISATENKHM